MSTKGSSKNFYSTGQSVSCPQTTTDDGTFSRSKTKEELNHSRKDIPSEKGFQFRDAFYYYAEDTNTTGRDRIQCDDKHKAAMKTKSPFPTSELITVLNIDCSYIKNYKVVGLCDNIIIAQDAVINQLVAIKVIIKPASDNGGRPFFPMGIPYMVPLIRYHETNSCIFLILKYMRKKNLYWCFLRTSRQKFDKSNNPICGYQGCNLLESEIASSLNGQLKSNVLSSSVNNLSGLTNSNREQIIQDVLPASCTCAIPVMDETDKTLSDVSSDALSDISEFNCAQFDIEEETNINNITMEGTELHTNNIEMYPETYTVSRTETNFGINPVDKLNHIDVNEEKKNIVYDDSIENIDNCFHNEGNSVSESHSFSISVEDMIRNSRELLNKVTKTLQRSNLKMLDSFPGSNCRISRTDMRSKSSRDLHHSESDSRCNYFNKSVSFDTSEMKYGSIESGETPVSAASEDTVKTWISQVIVALDSLHNQGIIWGNFNPSNVLFDENCRIMLTYKCYLPSTWVDSLKQQQRQLENKLLLESYLAPELKNPLHKPTRTSDWWSVGVLLYHMLTGQAISDLHPTGVTKHTEVHLSDNLSHHARMLLTQMLRADPRERLGYEGSIDIKDHAFFEGITWPEDIT